MFKKLSEQLKANPRTIVFTEGTDARILEAADKLTAEGVLGVILLGKVDEVKAAAKETGFDIDKCQIIDPEQYDDIDAMVDEMVTLRKGKMTPEQVRDALSKSNYNVSKDGQGRLSVRWSDLFYCRYSTSCITVNQNKAR